MNPLTGEEGEGAPGGYMLTVVVSKQTNLHNLNLGCNEFSSMTLQKLVTRIIESGVCNTLKELNLSFINFDSEVNV